MRVSIRWKLMAAFFSLVLVMGVASYGYLSRTMEKYLVAETRRGLFSEARLARKMAAKEVAEAAVIADYLPAQLSEKEIAGLVAAAIAQTGAAGEGMKAMGRVMGVVQPQVKGRADGAAVAAEVRRQLG